MLLMPLYDDTLRLRPPLVTAALITACVVVFLWQLGQGASGESDVAFAYGMVPAVLFGGAELPARLQHVPPWATLVTSMFLHGGWLHLIGNMIYLWIFGKGVESALGSTRYLIFYLICGIAAALTQGLTDPAAEVPMIGASGAIAGILGAYLLLYPSANVVVFFWLFIFVRFITVPAVLLLGLWFLLQLTNALSVEAGEPGVAFWAHIGGFITGALLVLVFRRREVAVLQPRRSRAFTAARRGPWG